MNSISKILLTITLLLAITSCNAQIKNTKTETVKIYGNCDMCEKTIENAGNIKKIAKVDWNQDTKMAILTYDSIKTNQDQILKRIALSGYDSDKFLAPIDIYSKLPECCKYDRKAQTVSKLEEPKMEMEKDDSSIMKTNQLITIFENYFTLKDALVKSDGVIASLKAKDLLNSINDLKMEKLDVETHVIWMKVMKDLVFDASHIQETKDVAHQREHFTSLSKNIYVLIKVSKQETPIYYQNCPMYNNGKGANWLSKENVIKNPYYGSQMLSCGKTVETIK